MHRPHLTIEIRKMQSTLHLSTNPSIYKSCYLLIFYLPTYLIINSPMYLLLIILLISIGLSESLNRRHVAICFVTYANLASTSIDNQNIIAYKNINILMQL